MLQFPTVVLLWTWVLASTLGLLVRMVTSTTSTMSASTIPTAEKKSPVTVSGITGIWAYCVRSSGDIYNYHDGSVASDSYGKYIRSPDIRYTSFWWVDISGAPDSYLHNDVSYSYGIRRSRMKITLFGIYGPLVLLGMVVFMFIFPTVSVHD